MPGVTLPYKLKTRLAEEIILEKARKMIELKRKVTLGEVEQMICDYCSMNIHNLKQMKRGKIRPSILTALKISQYFNCKVEDIFTLDE